MTSGSIERFADVGNYASYCRCVGSAHVSNGKKKGDGNTKNGNRYLAWAFVKAANFAVRFCEPGKGKMGKEKKGTHTIFSGRPYGNSRVLPFRAFPTALQAGQVLRPTAIGRIKKTDLGPRSWKLCASPLIPFVCNDNNRLCGTKSYFVTENIRRRCCVVVAFISQFALDGSIPISDRRRQRAVSRLA